jgi:hypothetical protein
LVSSTANCWLPDFSYLVKNENIRNLLIEDKDLSNNYFKRFQDSDELGLCAYNRENSLLDCHCNTMHDTHTSRTDTHFRLNDLPINLNIRNKENCE